MPATASPAIEWTPRQAAEADARFTEIATRHADNADGFITHRYAGTLLWGRSLQSDDR